MRLFVALEIPAAVRDNLAALLEDFRSLSSRLADKRPRWVWPENLHLTLKFIGEVAGEKIVAADQGAALRLNFKARKVFLVLGTASGRPLQASITLDGKPVGSNAGKDAPAGTVTVARNTLYELIDQHTMKHGVLEIRAQQAGLEAYAFTFGS